MKCLCISQVDRLVYGSSNRSHLYLLNPSPVITPLHFEGVELDHQLMTGCDAPALAFLEDSFDPISRVRRGRVYWLETSMQPSEATLFNPNRYRSKVKEEVFFYQSASLHKLKSLPSSAMPKVVLGGEKFSSIWKIVLIELDAHGVPVLVLKSYRSLGEIPDIQWEVIPKGLIKRLGERIEHVENAVNRSAPNDVVDRCRDALSLILSNLAGVPEKDLGDAIKAYSEQPEGKERLMVYNAAHLVRRLHSRGKPNEEHKLGTRPLEEDDAQLAVRSLGLVLKEVGWAV